MIFLFDVLVILSQKYSMIMKSNFWKKSPKIDFANSARSEKENTDFNYNPSLISVREISEN